ncbi:hypothetical protein QQ045_019218 [Rhodiola kirilowii]
MKGFDFYYVTNGSEKVAAHCKNQACPWRVYASLYKDGHENKSFMVKTLVPHLEYCPHAFDNSKVTVKFLTEYYLDAFIKNTKWNDEAFHAHVRDDLKVNVHRMKCFRARHQALQILEGESRVYICLDACKRGFLAKCRPIISLDSCILKGHYSGQIHSAVGRDGNDNMFSIAWAICEDIGMPKEHGWCFISDQQKGLREALKDLVPEAEHRLCVRHIYANFCKKFKCKELKDAMWACARASTRGQFIEKMKALKDLDGAAHSYMERFEYGLWAKHAFRNFTKCDCLCSNISECFNAYIRDHMTIPATTRHLKTI